MRPAEEIRRDVEHVSREIEEHEHRGELLKQQLAQLLLQARQHPEVSMEEAREIAGVSRMTAYELAKGAETE